MLQTRRRSYTVIFVLKNMKINGNFEDKKRELFSAANLTNLRPNTASSELST